MRDRERQRRLLNKRERRVTEKEREEKELDTVIKDRQK
jgi:hypothetical protein